MITLESSNVAEVCDTLEMESWFLTFSSLWYAHISQKRPKILAYPSLSLAIGSKPFLKLQVFISNKISSRPQTCWRYSALALALPSKILFWFDSFQTGFQSFQVFLFAFSTLQIFFKIILLIFHLLVLYFILYSNKSGENICQLTSK